jgi:ribosomal protein S12
VAHRRRVLSLSFTSVVPGVSSKVRLVVAGQHGKAPEVVNNSLRRVVQVPLSDGFEVVSYCSDGDGTYPANAQPACAHVREGCV